MSVTNSAFRNDPQRRRRAEYLLRAGRAEQYDREFGAAFLCDRVRQATRQRMASRQPRVIREVHPEQEIEAIDVETYIRDKGARA